MTMTSNSIDGILFFIIVIFALLAFLKGFIRDFFSTASLIIATTASYLIAPLASKMFSDGKTPQMMIDLGFQFGSFIVILIICSIVGKKISEPLSKKVPHIVDQSLGFGFGFVKGYLIISFIFAIFLSLYPHLSERVKIEKPSFEEVLSKNEPEKIGPNWFQESKSYELFYFGAKVILPFIDDLMSKIKVGSPNLNSEEYGVPNKEMDSIDSIIKTQKLYEDTINGDNKKTLPPTPQKEKKNDDTKPNKNDESGYTKQELEKMKRLIEIMSN